MYLGAQTLQPTNINFYDKRVNEVYKHELFKVNNIKKLI